MNIISWNVHFDVNEKKYSHIKQFPCDILILLECRHKSFEFIKDDWKYCLWYNDTLYENTSDYGIAVFSNKYRLDFTEHFNRKLRFVIPLEVYNDKEFLFYLFAVWTKSKPISYSINVLKALEFQGYKEYISDKAIFIGDFNTNVKAGQPKTYDNLVKTELIDCMDTEHQLTRTFYQNENYGFYTADYCFATKKMKDNYEIIESLGEMKESIQGNDKYEGLSDHCPVFVDIKSKLQ